MTHRLTGLLACLAFLAASVACGGDDDSPTGPTDGQASVDRIEVTPGADTLTALGNNQEFEAVALTSGGDTVTGVDFSWSSTDEAVTTVSDQGVAEAVANGDAEIRASTEGVTGSATMAVIQQVSSVSISPSSATLATVGDTTRFSASATDENGNSISDAEFVWQSENHAVATVDSSGLATSQGNGETSITVTAQDVPAHATLTVNQAISQLAFRTEPTSATAGEAIDPAVQVAVLDSAGNVVENAESAVTLSIGTNPGGGTLGGAATVNAVNGVATFSNVWIDMAATGYTLRASVSGVSSSPTSQTFDISAAEPDQLAFRTQPSNTEGQDPISPAVEVAVQDEFGNLVPSSSAEVTLQLEDDPTGRDASLSGTTAVSASSGVATFSDLSVARPGAGFTLVADVIGLSSVESVAFDIKLTFVQTDVADLHTCGVTASDHVYCWGNNGSGQLGDGTTAPDSVPVPVATTHSFRQVTAGGAHSCGVTTADEVYCWGNNISGQLGDGSTTDRSTPVAVSTTNSFRQVTAGPYHTCGVTTADEPYCWGRNSFGRLGDGTTTDRLTPVAVSTANSFRQVTAGAVHTCGVTTADEPYCWGLNDSGQLGDGTTATDSTPVAVSTTNSFREVTGGGKHTCGVTTADEPYCWGDNFSGKLGDGTTTDRSTPVAVSTTNAFRQVMGGNNHTCGVTTTDEAYCWGDNRAGQLGDGTTTARSTPVLVRHQW